MSPGCAKVAARGGGPERRARDPGVHVREAASWRQQDWPVTHLTSCRPTGARGKGSGKERRPGEEQAEPTVFEEFQNGAERDSGSDLQGRMTDPRIKGV